ncbi:glycosyltransferase family 39 protein [bacterium]|nr:glycosyltransferase family 39 protein [bacterium]
MKQRIRNLLKIIVLNFIITLGLISLVNLFGLSLNLEKSFLFRILWLTLLCLFVVSFSEIKAFYLKSALAKKFILLSLLNIFLFSLVFLFYSIFRSGSPLIWEDRLSNFRPTRKIAISSDKPIIQTFTAKSNNLGTIGVKILVKEKKDERESVEEGSGEIRDKVVFRIKEKQAKDWFYENTYEFGQYFQSGFFPFGFPLQENSKGKEYIFELERIGAGSGRVFLVEKDKDGILNFYPRYVYNLASLKTSWQTVLPSIWKNIGRKVFQFLGLRTTQINLLFVFLFIESLIFVFLKKNDVDFINRFLSLLRYFFIISFLLATTISFNFNRDGSLRSSFFEGILYNLSGFSPLLSLLAVSFGVLFFYFKKKTLEKLRGKASYEKVKKEGARELIDSKVVYFFLFIIIIWASVLRLYNIGRLDIHHDEYWYASAIKSYIHTGSTNLWNYATKEPSARSYPKFITILVGNFVKLFGYNETNLRLPFAFAGVVSVVLLFFLTKEVTDSNIISLCASLMLALDDVSIYLSRFIRQYSILSLISILLAFCIVKDIKKAESNRIRWINSLFLFLVIVFSFKYISPLSLSFLPIYFFYLLVLFLKIKNSKIKIYFIVLLSFFLFITILDYFSLIKLINIRHVFKNNLLFGFDLQRSKDYFAWTFGVFKLSPLVTLLLCVLSSIIFLIRRREVGLLIVSFFWFPYFILNFNLYHSHDFRYVSYLLPFLFIIFSYILHLIYKIGLFPRSLILCFLILLIFILRPSLPGINIPPVTIKAQGDWSENEGGRIHRRAVAPEYKKVFFYLNKIQEAGDNVIIVDGIQYLDSKEGINYFLLNPWGRNDWVLDLRKGTKRNFLDLVANNQGRVFVVGAYFHMLKSEIVDYLTKNCRNLSPSLSVKSFTYNSFYIGKNLYWPNLFVCPSN